MRIIYFLLLTIAVCYSCKNETKTPEASNSEDVTVDPNANYPDAIAKVFDAHGGIAMWNDMGQLKYTMEKEGGDEIHTVNLKSRKTLIETGDYKLGFDGEKIWLAQDSTHFPTQRARFYHNLYFYFYAMPFVLGDDGITYTEVDPLTFEGKSYPGTKISYGSGIGDSPDDNYILYRDPETNKMAWLAYTVTYGSNQTSDRYSYIKYDQWEDVSDVLLPKAIQWYTVEEGQPVSMRNEQKFANALVSKAPPFDDFFIKPEDGVFVE